MTPSSPTPGIPRGYGEHAADAEHGFDLLYRVCRLTGHGSRASGRIARGLLRDVVIPDREPARRVRNAYAQAVSSELSQHTDSARLGEALRAAILWDELTLLPPRQQRAVRAAIVDRKTSAEIAENNGWSIGQTQRLLRQGLLTISRSQSSDSC
ncbi:hypothetical protein [Actinophytocola sp. NPDC049390]|uniref:hypothetical protein n=1 Tax=Actinophytocola sp. NPDC049390 TaxID=3363894 RepID=UPI0037B50E06